MAVRMALCVAVVLLVLVQVWEKEKNEAEFLTEAEMRVLVGGAAGCDFCVAPNERLDECAHLDKFDPCQSVQCIENHLIEDTCNSSDVENCWAQLNPDLDYLIQYLRTDVNCTTNQPTWQLWRIHYYDMDCEHRNFYKRCVKNNGYCTGTLVDTATRSNAIECI